MKIGDIIGDYKIIDYVNYSFVGECLVCGHTKTAIKQRWLQQNPKHKYSMCREEFLKYEYLNKVFEDMLVYDFYSVGEKQTKKVMLKLKCLKCNTKRDVFIKDFERKLGLSHGLACTMSIKADASFHKKWNSMIARCNYPTATGYENYGGRGIKCLYSNFKEFYDDLHESYLTHCEIHGKSNTTLERIDVNGNYMKGNCKWATWKEQHSNKRNSVNKK